MYGAKPVLWKSMPTRIGQAQVADAPARPGDGPQRAAAEAERVGLDVVVVEHRPGPADHRVGVDVRPVRQLELRHQRVAHGDDAFEVVQAEGVGRPHRGDDGGDLLALPQAPRVPGVSSWSQVHLVVGQARHGDELIGAQAEPAGEVVAAIVGRVGREDHGRLADAAAHGVGAGLLQADLGAVEVRAGAAEGEDAAGSFGIVADQAGGQGGDLDLGQGDAAAATRPRTGSGCTGPRAGRRSGWGSPAERSRSPGCADGRRW